MLSYFSSSFGLSLFSLLLLLSSALPASILDSASDSHNSHFLLHPAALLSSCLPNLLVLPSRNTSTKSCLTSTSTTPTAMGQSRRLPHPEALLTVASSFFLLLFHRFSLFRSWVRLPIPRSAPGRTDFLRRAALRSVVKVARPHRLRYSFDAWRQVSAGWQEELPDDLPSTNPP